MNPEGLYPVRWSPPGYRKGTIQVGTALLGVVLAPKPLMGISGTWNACDLYIQCPVSWLDCEVTLFAELDGLRVPIVRKLIREADYQSDGVTITALVFSVRGHPVTGWDVAMTPVAGSVGVGLFRFMAWGQDGSEESPKLTPRRYDSAGLDDQDVIEAAPIKLLQVWGINNSADRRYFQLFSRITAAPNLTVPDLAPLGVNSGQMFSATFNDGGWRFELGCVWASSSTLATLTLTAAPDMWVTALYRGP